jgi:O-antigen/teichoic acid export membrane protein
MTEESSNSYRHILKYTSIFGSVQGLNVLAALVRNKFTAVFLGPAGMGLVSLLNTWQGFVCQATNLGISTGAVPQLSELYEKDNMDALNQHIVVIRTWSIIAAAIGFFFCLAVSPVMALLIGGSESYISYFLLIAPAIILLAISNGEIAILKATRRLKSLAKVQTVSAIASIIVTIPLYYYLGIDGIVPVMLSMAFVTMIVTVAYSYSYYPFSIKFSKDVIAGGKSMIYLGIAFVTAAIVSSLSELLIRIYLNDQGQMDEVGFYNAAYMMTISYAALVLAAVESDYFPRLSAISHDLQQIQTTVNSQVDVLFLLVAPMMTALMVFLPLLVPILYTDKFTSIIPMAQIMVVAMYFKALSLPISYIPLAFRRSRSYLFLEILYCVYFLIFFFLGYSLWGMCGVAVAWVISHIIEWVVVWFWANHYYHYQLSSSICRHIIIQMAIAAVAWLGTKYCTGSSYWIVGTILIMMSIGVSFYLIYRKK